MSDVIFEPINVDAQVEAPVAPQVEAPPGLSGLEEPTGDAENKPPIKESGSTHVSMAAPAPKKRGRPKGSPNKPKAQTKETVATEPLAIEPTRAPPKKRKPAAKMESEEESSEEQQQLFVPSF